jgi:hypothetical protein
MSSYFLGNGGIMIVIQILIFIKLLLLTAILFICLKILLRGRVFAIQKLYIEITFYLYFLLILVQEIIASSGFVEWPLQLMTISLLVFAIFIIIEFNDLRNHYLFWGVNEKVLLGVIENILNKDQLEYKDEGNNLILKKYPEALYRHNAFAATSAGTIISTKNTKKGKVDQCQIIPKIKERLLGYASNISSKLFLIVFILFTCFVIYTTYLQFHY